MILLAFKISNQKQYTSVNLKHYRLAYPRKCMQQYELCNMKKHSSHILTFLLIYQKCSSCGI